MVALYRGSLSSRTYVRLRLRFVLGSADVLDAAMPTRGVIADLGCGYGILANRLAVSAPSRIVIGVDADARRIASASSTVGSRTNIRFERADITRRLPDGLDAAVLTDALHHLDASDQDGLIGRLARAIVRGGTLIVSEVDPTARPRWRYWLSYLSDVALYWKPGVVRSRFRTPKDFTRVLRSHGFEPDPPRAAPSAFASVVYVARRL